MSRGKSEIRISNIETNWSKIQNQEAMSHNENSKRYDLEERTSEFAKASRAFVKQLPRTISNIEDVKQFIRASGSIGANYIEANEAIGKKDFVMKIKICCREAKESRYWLRLIDTDGKLEGDQARLLDEADELMKIFGAIARKSEQ
ncbi:MAG TPA: four helix bundle protein [Candidatus Binatus sp.]|nr:four helix bundle protein [Candidatus Binatus sp.]